MPDWPRGRILKRLAIAALAVLKVADAKVARQIADLLVTFLDKVVHGAQYRIGVGNDHGIKVLTIAPAVEHNQVSGSVGKQGVVFLTQLSTISTIAADGSAISPRPADVRRQDR